MNELVCIFCKKNSLDGEDHILTDEHIVPQIIGGWLTIPYVCKKCNNLTFGSKFEADLKGNGYIVSALDKLKIKSKKEAYRAADLRLLFPSKEEKLKAYFDEKGFAQFFPQKLKDNSLLVPEDKAKEILSKQIERYEKEHGIKIAFDLDSYSDLPYNIVIPIHGTDISFKKTRDEKADLYYHNLTKPISHLLPATISFELLSSLDYNLVMNSNFDSFRNWILENGENTFVLLNRHLRGRDPLEVNYLPNHFIRFSYYSDCLVAVVGIFGVFKYSVFFGKINNLESPQLLRVLDKYMIFDLANLETFLFEGDDQSIVEDKQYLESMARYGLIMNKLENV
ncbi:MAG: HNH endonuclease [Melioribacteraceae bacterium]|nr:HNH endonuclease [Melioribacteraceae bacterium]